MIHEDDLRRLLADAAESAPAPGRGPEALLDAVASQARVTPARRPPARMKLVAAAAVVIAVVAVGASLTGDEGTSSFTETGQATGDAEGGGDVAPGAGTDGGSDEAERLVENAAPLDEGEPDGDLASRPEALRSAAVPSAGGGPAQPAPPTDGARIIRTGSLDLEVREGTFAGTVERIIAQTTGLGGYVAESTTSESGDSPSGSITVRVPGESFDTLLADLRELGEVRGGSSRGTDVTAQFTDLAARLTALQATRDRLATVLSEASNVPDILSVQDRITGVQIEIETVQGQQKLLEDQASFATLAITLGEPGAEIIDVQADPDDGLGGAWDDARRRFGDAIEGIVAWSGSAAVVLIVGLILLALSRLAWVGRRRRLV
ncbi:MAG: DUF4349 domain-containing protein [Acidimicrobiales bacterium]